MPQNSARAAYLARNRFIILFWSMMGFLVVVPLVEELRPLLHSAVPSLVERLAFLAVLIVAVLSIREERAWRVMLLALATLVVVMGWLQMSITLVAFVVAHYFIVAVFLSYIIAGLLLYVFSERSVSTNTVCAALVAYLLLSIVWADVYALITVLDPTAFASSNQNLTLPFHIGTGAMTSVIYFSLATMTTLGYGDIVPVSPLARMATALEAVTGQLYLAVLMARLVGLQISSSLEQKK
jgi:hypothetical protein